MEKDKGEYEFYSNEMKQIAVSKNPNIKVEKDYIVIQNEDEKMYFDNSGKEIKDISGLKRENYPDKIGDYSKEQITVENVYYVKK